MINKYDNEKKRCPKLGHEVGFDYCRNPASETPCSKVFDCWYQKFDIVGFVKDNYGDEMLTKIQSPPKPKTLSLLELIEQAKQANKDE
jgi:hypothetical protein